MNLILHPLATPRIGHEFEYLNTFVKSKRGKEYRHHFRNVKTGAEYLLYLDDAPTPFNHIEMLSVGDKIGTGFEVWKVSDTHFKNGRYNYYLKGKHPELVNQLFEKWKSSNPMVSVGGFIHQYISDIPDYDWRFSFNNIKY
jgi:hypothetical protein